MQIEERDGKQVVVFEVKDGDLERNFRELMSGGDGLWRRAEEAAKAHKISEIKLQVAKMALELHWIENDDQLRDPINAALIRDLNLSKVPGLTYNYVTKLLTVDRESVSGERNGG